MSPPVAWFLLRAPRPEEHDEIKAMPYVSPEGFDAAVAAAREHGWYDGGEITPTGHAVRDQLVAARTDCLRELIADWEPGADPELDPLLRRLAHELAKPPQREVSISR